MNNTTGDPDQSDGKVVAIMQPYFLPYIGYWQLMRAADVFVVYDDVQFSKGGWINRNRMLLNGAPHTFTLPLKKGSVIQKITERELSENWPKARVALRAKFDQAYASAPWYSTGIEVIEDILEQDTENLADYLFGSIQRIRRHLDIRTQLLRSTEIEAGQGLRASARVIAICKALGADIYVNAPGGRDLYDPAEFNEQGLTLRFIQPDNVAYRQFDNSFVPGLSVLDAMMFNRPDEIRTMLSQYKLG